MQEKARKPAGLLTAAALAPLSPARPPSALNHSPLHPGSDSSSSDSDSDSASSQCTDVTAAPDAPPGEAPLGEAPPGEARPVPETDAAAPRRRGSFAFARPPAGAAADPRNDWAGGYGSDSLSHGATSPLAQCMTLGARAMARAGAQDDGSFLADDSPTASDELSARPSRDTRQPATTTRAPDLSAFHASASVMASEDSSTDESRKEQVLTRRRSDHL